MGINKDAEMSPEFISEVGPEILNKEIIDIEIARFIDSLQPEHEQEWEELITLGKDTDLNIEDLMTPVWLVESLPKVFRDRAMLLVVGTREVRKALGQESYRTNGSFAFGNVSVSIYEKVFGGFDPALFCAWTQEAWKYQHETNLPVISDQRYLNWNYEFFERELISEAQLDDFLSSIDIAASSPTWEGSGWDDDVYPLDENRFPLLSDILNGRTVTKDSAKVLTWALDLLGDWLSYQKDERVDIPEWLRAVPRDTGQALFLELINGGDKPEWLRWDMIRSATDHFGLGIFNSHSSDFDLITVHKVDNLQFKEELLKVILRSQNIKAISGSRYYPLTRISYSGGSKGEVIRSIDIMQRVVMDTYDIELKELFDLELKHAEEYEERSRQESEKRMREYKAKREASPEYQEQQRARAAFLSRVTGLSQLKS